jgi:hypothetical protein
VFYLVKKTDFKHSKKMVENYSFQQSRDELPTEEVGNNRALNEVFKNGKKERAIITRSPKYKLTLEPAIFLSTLANILQVGIN